MTFILIATIVTVSLSISILIDIVLKYKICRKIDIEFTEIIVLICAVISIYLFIKNLP